MHYLTTLSNTKMIQRWRKMN